MAGTTTNLGLYFKEPLTDGNDTFNIQTMLNDNWNKLDAAIGDVKTPASKMGLSGDLSIGRCLNVLANIGNVHVWQRVQTYTEKVPATYTVGEEESGDLYTDNKSSSRYPYLQLTYGDSISVNDNGTIIINDATIVGPDYVTESKIINAFKDLPGKYCRITVPSNYLSYIGTYVEDVIFVPTTATVTIEAGNTYIANATAYQRVVGTPAIPAGTHTDYLTSTDPNAYPDNVSDAQDAHYVLGPAVTGNFKLSANYNSSSIVHALSITVDDDGNISLVNGVEVPASKYDDTLVNALKGRFVTADSTDIYSAFENGATIYIPNDASINRTSGLTISKYQPVTGYPAIPANTVITYLGQLGEPGARIEVGSYVGTGTRGSTNKNSYTFQNRPIMFFLFGNPINGNGVITIRWGQNSACSVSKTYAAGFRFDSISWNGNTVSWYGESDDAQANYAGEQYTIVAIR